jgi:hypothetical protein
VKDAVNGVSLICLFIVDVIFRVTCALSYWQQTRVCMSWMMFLLLMSYVSWITDNKWCSHGHHWSRPPPVSGRSLQGYARWYFSHICSLVFKSIRDHDSKHIHQIFLTINKVQQIGKRHVEIEFYSKTLF